MMKKDHIPLSYSQERIWIVEQMGIDDVTYNYPMVFRLCGEVDEKTLEQSVNDIVGRHESLRTIFEVVDGQPRQIILPELELKFVKSSLQDLPGGELENKIQVWIV